MILIFTSILCLLGGVDAYLTCASCNDFKGALLPWGSSSPYVELVVNNFITADGCKIASFKCVPLSKGGSATAFIKDSATGERLVTYEPSETESIGGNLTCVATPKSAGWRFNGAKPSLHCNMKWSLVWPPRMVSSSPEKSIAPTTTT